MAVKIMKKPKAASPSPAEQILLKSASTKVKSKPKPKPKKKKGPHDILQDLVADIEVLTTADQAHAALRKVHITSVFYMGGLLQRILENKWFKIKGYDSFQAYVEAETDLALSTAYDYAAMYVSLTNAGILWEQVEELGWTKVRLIAKYLTKDTLAELVERAKVSAHAELREYLKTHKNHLANSQTAPPVANSGVVKESETGGSEALAADLKAIHQSSKQPQADPDEPQQVDDKPPPKVSAFCQPTFLTMSFRVVPEQEQLILKAVKTVKAQLELDDTGDAHAAICDKYMQTLQE